MTVPVETAPSLSAHPGLAHGFFGRQGGLSAGDFASLNVSEATGDAPDAVAANRARIAGALGFMPARLALLRQVHSARVVTLSAPPEAPIEADAMVSATPGLLLGILTADCAPVLLADPAAGVIGAAHAGWRGAVEGVLANTVAQMVALGAEPARMIAALGPTIAAAHYEIGPDFRAAVLARDPALTRHFHSGPGAREHFDLPGLVLDQLRAAGIGSVSEVGGSTYGARDRYFSHRFATHAGVPTGRQLAVIGRH